VSATNAPSRAQKLVEKDDVIFATTRPTQMRYSLIDEEHLRGDLKIEFHEPANPT
jgi:type I restriction enzyme S subunit